MSEKISNLVTHSLELGQHILAGRSAQDRKKRGQFFTPTAVARFMARQLGPIRSGDRILDPAIGSGVLACAVIERAIAEGHPREFWLDGYEIDHNLCQTAREVLELATLRAAARGITIHTSVYEGDFVLNVIPTSQPYLLLAEGAGRFNTNALYDHIIANPPYFKLNSNDPRVKAAAGQVKGHTNIYTLFLALAVKKLAPRGQACFIVPRSFCSGLYFSALRQKLVEETLPLAVHLFESRQDTFKSASALQENIIFTFRRRKNDSRHIPLSTYLKISASKNGGSLSDTPLNREISMKQFLGRRKGTLFFRLPTSELDERIVETMDSWTGSLNQYGLDVSTGPVVAFRARPWLMDVEAVTHNKAVPLLWMQNVKRQQVDWPVSNGQKSQGISLAQEAQSLLVPAANYILLRRFSAKEDPRRLIAAPFLAEQYSYQWLGLENHLNYIYRKQGALDVVETLGLSTLLNSSLIDRYFRIVNGNTQVNATELRALPLPPLEFIRKIGERVLTQTKNKIPIDIEDIIFTNLWKDGYLPPDFPIIRETRITMGKIQEAQDVLKTLGLPPGQQNEMSALTMLVLAQLAEETPWNEAKRHSLRIHDILLAIKEYYDREYAENTRETIRRQVIHQFIQAGLVLRNPDNPALPTNSPRTHYALSDEAINTIRAYRSAGWQQAVQSFKPEHLIHFNGDHFLGPR